MVQSGLFTSPCKCWTVWNWRKLIQTFINSIQKDLDRTREQKVAWKDLLRSEGFKDYLLIVFPFFFLSSGCSWRRSWCQWWWALVVKERLVQGSRSTFYFRCSLFVFYPKKIKINQDLINRNIQLPVKNSHVSSSSSLVKVPPGPTLV